MKVGNIDNLTLRRAATIAAFPLALVALAILNFLICLIEDSKAVGLDYADMMKEDYGKIRDSARRSWYD